MHAVPHDDRLPLDGRWRFQLLHRPDEAPGEAWGEADVPGCWTMQDTWDRPIYTNVQMPFPNRPPETPEENPTGVYERAFEVPAGWAGRRVVLHVGAAESVLLVEVNGRGRRDQQGLASRGRVRGHRRCSRPGANELRLTVVKWSDASFIEDQDQWWHGGITRPVFLYATGSTYLADLVVDAGLGGRRVDRHAVARGRPRLAPAPGPSPGWRVEAEVEGGRAPMAGDVRDAPPPPGTPADWSVPGPPRRGVVDLQSLNAAGALTAPDDVARWREAEPVVRPTRVGRVRLATEVADVRPWSAEVPSLYRLEVRWSRRTAPSPSGSSAGSGSGGWRSGASSCSSTGAPSSSAASTATTSTRGPAGSSRPRTCAPTSSR